MLKLNDVSFYYENKLVLDKLTYNFEAGHIYGLIGANGAGKTTLLKTIANAYQANSGNILYNDLNTFDNMDYLKEMFYLDHEFYYGNYSCLSLLKYISRNKLQTINYQEFNLLCEMFSFDKKTPIKKLSKGNKRLAYLIVCFSLNFKLIILDEFLDGIDLVNRKKVKTLILDYVYEHNITLIISSHTTSDIQDICDELILLKDHHFTTTCSSDSAKELYKSYQLVLDKSLNYDDLSLMGLELFNYKQFENIRWFSILNTPQQVEIVNNIKVLDLKEYSLSLEEVIYNEFIK